MVEDSAEDTVATSLSAFRKLRTAGVNMIVGPSWRPAGNAIAPVAKRHKDLLMISPSLGVRDFNEAGENLFNVWPMTS